MRERLSDVREPLLNLCLNYGSSKYEDRRDKVFGFLAFTLECYREAIEVDYSSSLLEISTELLRHNASKHKYLYPEIGTTKRLHQMLGVTMQYLELPAPLESISPAKQLTQGDSTFRIDPPVRGLISYVSELLGAELLQKKVEVRKTPSPGRLVPHEERYIRSQYWNGDLRQTHELTIVSALRAEISGFIDKRISFPNRPLLRTASLWIRGKVGLWHTRLRAWRYSGRALQFARAAALKSGAGRCRLAINENGLVFFALLEVMVGDLVCWSGDDDSLMFPECTGVAKHPVN